MSWISPKVLRWRSAKRLRDCEQKHKTDSDSGHIRRSHQASRGQIVILTAGALVALIGMVGLATDLGYNFAQRRTMQNAADAGALAGAHAIGKSDPSVPVSVLSDVQSAVSSNTLGGATPSITSCVYVNDSDESLGNCSGTIPSTSPDIATGVRITVTETHSTFFLRAVPGGPNSMTTKAGATAHVQWLKNPPGDGPFLVCGINPKIDSGPTNINILTKDASGNWQLNPNAVSTSETDTTHPTFQVFGPNISRCGLGSSEYKGQAVGTSNESRTAPGWFNYQNGDAAGHVSVSVSGVDGCTPSEVINCVAFLPVAVDTPPPTSNQMWTVMILPFYLTAVSTSNGQLNKLDGKIIGSYVSSGEGKPGFIPGTNGAIVIRLTK